MGPLASKKCGALNGKIIYSAVFNGGGAFGATPRRAPLWLIFFSAFLHCLKRWLQAIGLHSGRLPRMVSYVKLKYATIHLTNEVYINNKI
jgi:hypothetical protein